jgi:predicted kinase
MRYVNTVEIKNIIIKMDVKLIICRGMPASGKSTYSRQWVFEDFKKRVRVNRDDIRNMLGKYWVPSREHLVTSIERSMVADSLFRGYNVILDATNIESKKFLINRWNDHIKNDIEFKDFFDVPLEECIRRDSERTDMKVGEDVIKRFYSKQLKIIENE